MKCKCVWVVLVNVYKVWGKYKERKLSYVCLYQFACPLVCQTTFRYEEGCVVEVSKSIAVVAFSFPFLVSLLTQDESCEGAIHRVIGHLSWREDRGRNQESGTGI